MACIIRSFAEPFFVALEAKGLALLAFLATEALVVVVSFFERRTSSDMVLGLINAAVQKAVLYRYCCCAAVLNRDSK